MLATMSATLSVTSSTFMLATMSSWCFVRGQRRCLRMEIRKYHGRTDGRTNLRTGMLYLISWNPLLVKIIAPKKWLILHSANQSSAKKRWLVHFTCDDVYVLKRSSGGRVCLIIKFSLIIFDRSILSPSFSSLLEETLTACSKIE